VELANLAARIWGRSLCAAWPLFVAHSSGLAAPKLSGEIRPRPSGRWLGLAQLGSAWLGSGDVGQFFFLARWGEVECAEWRSQLGPSCVQCSAWAALDWPRGNSLPLLLVSPLLLLAGWPEASGRYQLATREAIVFPSFAPEPRETRARRPPPSNGARLGPPRGALWWRPRAPRALCAPPHTVCGRLCALRAH